MCGVIINVVCFFRSLKKSDTDNQKKLEAKTEELEKIKSEYKTIKDSITEKDRLMQGKIVVNMNNGSFEGRNRHYH